MKESVKAMFKSVCPAFVMMFVLIVVGCAQADDSDATQGSSALQISSPAFAAGAAIPERFSCQGEASSPPLEWTGVPDTARSLALIVQDPDAPSGTYTHWVVYNLAADSDGLKAGASATLPGNAAQGENDKGASGYTGVCPPGGEHRYRFKLYALDTMLDVDDPDTQALRAAMKGHIVGKATLEGVYSRE